MNAIETRVSQRHATHFEISIGGQISEIFLEWRRFGISWQTNIYVHQWRDKTRKREREKKKRCPTDSRSLENHSFIVSFVNFFSPSVEISSARKIVHGRWPTVRKTNKFFPLGIRTKENAISETADSGVIGMAPCRHFRRGR